MPIIKSIVLGNCDTDSSGSATGRIVTYIVDSAGTGALDYSTNNGVLPDDLDNDFDVFQNGNRLDYPDQYTATEFGVDSTTSRIQIISPLPPAPVYYTIIAYYE